MGQSDQPLGLALSEELGPLPPERAAFEAWLNPGHHAGNVSAWVEPGRYESDRHQMVWLGWKAGVSAQRERMIADGWRQTRYVAPVTDCEACLTPDACAIRGQCAHYLRERE